MVFQFWFVFNMNIERKKRIPSECEYWKHHILIQVFLPHIKTNFIILSKVKTVSTGEAIVKRKQRKLCDCKSVVKLKIERQKEVSHVDEHRLVYCWTMCQCNNRYHTWINNISIGEHLYNQCSDHVCKIQPYFMKKCIFIKIKRNTKA